MHVADNKNIGGLMIIKTTETRGANRIIVDNDYYIDGYPMGRVRHISDLRFNRLKTYIVLDGDVQRIGVGISDKKAHNCMIRLLEKNK